MALVWLLGVGVLNGSLGAIIALLVAILGPYVGLKTTEKSTSEVLTQGAAQYRLLVQKIAREYFEGQPLSIDPLPPIEVKRPEDALFEQDNNLRAIRKSIRDFRELVRNIYEQVEANRKREVENRNAAIREQKGENRQHVVIKHATLSKDYGDAAIKLSHQAEDIEKLISVLEVSATKAETKLERMKLKFSTGETLQTVRSKAEGIVRSTGEAVGYENQGSVLDTGSVWDESHLDQEIAENEAFIGIMIDAIHGFGQMDNPEYETEVILNDILGHGITFHDHGETLRAEVGDSGARIVKIDEENVPKPQEQEDKFLKHLRTRKKNK